jgi:hypothetical protein
MKLRWPDALRPNRGTPADLDHGGLFSPEVIAGARPRWLYREAPADEIDSGWRIFEGGEDDDWLQQPGNCVLQHLGHVVEAWPDVLPVLQDSRIRSAWEWDETAGRYVEVRGWRAPD